MGFIVLKKITLLFLLVSASLVSASLAGGRSSFLDGHAADLREDQAMEVSGKSLHHERADRAVERMLKVNTKDYASYDPAPALVKPPFKLIPN